MNNSITKQQWLDVIATVVGRYLSGDGSTMGRIDECPLCKLSGHETSLDDACSNCIIGDCGNLGMGPFPKHHVDSTIKERGRQYRRIYKIVKKWDNMDFKTFFTWSPEARGNDFCVKSDFS
jgi:hypothetical protein